MNTYFLFLMIPFISLIQLSLQKEELISLNDITHYEAKDNKRYAFYLNLTSNLNMEDIFIYVDKDVNTRIVEVEEEEKSFTIDKSIITYGNIYNNLNSFYINKTEAISKKIVGYYFIIPATKIKFSINVVELKFKNKRKITQYFYKERTEKLISHYYEDIILFSSDLLETTYFTPHCDINHYQKFDEKYIHYIEKQYDFPQFFVEIIKMDNNKIIVMNTGDPIILEDEFDIICYDIERKDNDSRYFFEVGFNEFNIKCQNHNNEKLNEGDFVEIYLEKGEETTLNLPKVEDNLINIEIGLKIKYEIERKESEIMKVEFSDSKNNKITLFQNYTKFRTSWDISKKNTIKIKNIGNRPVLIFLKIAVPRDMLVVYNESTSNIILEPDKLYAFYICKDARNFNISGDIEYYQFIGSIFSLLLNEKVDNFSFYREFTVVNYSSYAPRYSYESINSFYKEKYIYSLDHFYSYTPDEEYYYFFSYHGKKDKKIIMDYKLYLYLKFPETNFIPETNNKLFFPAVTYLPLMVQIIQNTRKNESYINFRHESNYTTYGNSYELINSFVFNYDKKDFYYEFEFMNNKKLIILFNEVTDPLHYSFEPINDNFIKGELIKEEHSNKYKYIFDFKPLEESNIAEYYIYLFNGSYNFQNLTSEYFLYTEIFEKYPSVKNFSLESENGDFNEKDKEEFFINLEYSDNLEYYIAIIARQKYSYKSFKFYPAVKIINFEEINQIINLDDEIFEKTKEFDFILNGKQIINLEVINKNKYSKGKLLIQWKNDLPFKFSHLTIYKYNYEKSEMITNINTDEIFYYVLDILEEESSFKISYSLNDNNTKNLKIFLFFMPRENRKAIDDNVNYSYMSAVVLPYFIKPERPGPNYEIFRFKYNNDKIKDIKIKVELFHDYYDEFSETEYLDKYDLRNLDDYQFIKINYAEKYNAISLEIKLELKDDLSINDKPEEFNIKRIQTYFDFNIFPNGNLINIEANNIHKFYFVNASNL